MIIKVFFKIILILAILGFISLIGLCFYTQKKNTNNSVIPIVTENSQTVAENDQMAYEPEEPAKGIEAVDRASNLEKCKLPDEDANLISTKSPLDLSIKVPKFYSYKITSDDDKNDWGIEIITPEKTSINMCTGCNIFSTIVACGFEHEKCTEQPMKISNIDFSMDLLKETGRILSIGSVLEYKGTAIWITLDNKNTLDDDVLEEIETVLSCTQFPER